MRKYLLLCVIVLSALPIFSQNSITVTIPETWKKVYAWIWNTTNQYNERFIPLKKVDTSTWTLDIDVDLSECKKAGILFTDTDSWNSDMQRTEDAKLNGSCFSIPQEVKERQIVKMNSGAVCRVVLYECNRSDCNE